MHNRSYIKGHEDHPHYISDKTLLFLRDTFADANKHQDIVLILKTLSDPTRLNIYLILHKVDEIPVTDICQVLDLNQSTVSHALSDLKKLGLVESSRCGQLICYSLKKQPKKRSRWLAFFEKFFT